MWLDALSLIIYGGLIYLAYHRGVVLEITEFIAIIVAGLLGFRLFRPIGAGMHNMLFKGWSLSFLQKGAFFTVFIIAFLGVFSIGLTLERRMKEEKQIEKEIDKRAGAFVGIFKAAWMTCLILGLMFYLEIVPIRQIPKLKRGPVVSAFLGLRIIAAPTIYIMAPGDLAKDFIKVGLEPSRRGGK